MSLYGVPQHQELVATGEKIVVEEKTIQGWRGGGGLKGCFGDPGRGRFYVCDEFGLIVESPDRRYTPQTFTMRKRCANRYIRWTDDHHVLMTSHWNDDYIIKDRMALFAVVPPTRSRIKRERTVPLLRLVWEDMPLYSYMSFALDFAIVDQRWIWVLRAVKEKVKHAWTFEICVYSLVDGRELESYTIRSPIITTLGRPRAAILRDRTIYALHDVDPSRKRMDVPAHLCLAKWNIVV
jgi:hypothetical protein